MHKDLRKIDKKYRLKIAKNKRSMSFYFISNEINGRFFQPGSDQDHFAPFFELASLVDLLF